MTAPDNKYQGDHQHRAGVGGVNSQRIQGSRFEGVSPTPLAIEVMTDVSTGAEVHLTGLPPDSFFNQQAHELENTNTLEAVITGVTAVLRRILGIEKVYVENIDNLKRVLKVRGMDHIQYPRTSISFDSLEVPTEALHGGVAMKHHGLTTPVRGIAQRRLDRIRWIPQRLSLRVLYLDSDYIKTLRMSQQYLKAAGMRSFNLEVKFANGVTHRLHIDAAMSATVGALEFDGSPDPGTSTLEFSLDITTNVISIIKDEPVNKVDIEAGFTDDDVGLNVEAVISTEPELSLAQQTAKLFESVDSIDAQFPPITRRTI